MSFLHNPTARNIQPLWIPVAVLGGLLLVSLVVQLTLAWLSYDRILPASRHIDHLDQLQQTLTQVETTLAHQLPDSSSIPPESRSALQQALQDLLTRVGYLANSTSASIRQAQQVLKVESAHPRETLLTVMNILREIFQQESRQHKDLTKSIFEASRFELELGVIVVLTLPLAAAILLTLMRRRILSPLQQMGYLMETLGKRQYQRIPAENVDPTLQPLMENYNTLVVRLSELEAEHLQYEQQLEQQVEKAARTLIEQQRSLANTERLAALGEVMARLAHELRNPLAGVKMACTNIRREIADSGEDVPHKERIELVGQEIDRMIQMLNSLLDQAHHQPEQLTSVQLDKAISDLLTLARYQMPEHISLHQEVPAAIVCRLPDTGLRQVLLNLILNARQALDSEPGTITVKAALENSILTISVSDDGPGFPPDLLENNIRAFNTHRVGGTGLGLSMVQRFARAHGGKLLLSSLEPHGACVTLRLNCVG
ncbi:sensor histidine kinase [Thiothrix nivea]|uniref:histidine kinase n=1 Tax=Thiothrix nivea (strain ATCC 35100 / DSM 5205 / JP2) TaxID=870187 RepID=A0A656HNK0_THINJ|nr:ATP-binding protein [Thiothrix nivea]EIJ36919.1 integral membrane sensor signal transduction histidine kinase [Thiothrix nivea DSM 5205]